MNHYPFLYHQNYYYYVITTNNNYYYNTFFLFHFVIFLYFNYNFAVLTKELKIK